MSRGFTIALVLALVLGVAVGYLCHVEVTDPATLARLAGYFGIVTDAFLRLIKMIIGPLVFSTLVVGIANMGAGSAVGRVGLRTVGWFLFASLLSLAIGIVMVLLLEPGRELALGIPQADAAAAVTLAQPGLREFVQSLVPRSIAEAMANNAILQIVVFSVFFGIGLAALGERGRGLTALIDQVAHVMLKVTGYVMWAAPPAVFAAVAATVTAEGLGILGTYGKFIGGYYFALVVLWLVLLGLGWLVIGARVRSLVAMIREPLLLAFSTASSEAAYPKTLEQLERFGVAPRIASFVLPLGYSFNLDGSMMYCTFATLFIAQAYGIELGGVQLVTLLLLLLVTSKGIAGVPRASLVVLAATLPHFGIPDAGLLLVLAVDQFLDMGRSATNVVGNSVASAVVAKWEGELGAPST
ncbi:MAG: Proton/sodium-glutamate symport protein [Steroidobacteraceae bacterium]|nr:Proton/sodium-glutamate symport protein [Steroidobacteraceae bacterium]